MLRFLGLIAFTATLAGCLDSVEPEVIYEWNGGVDAATPDLLDRRFEAAFVWYENQQVFLAAAGVEGDEPDATRPWQIRSGTCAAPGAVVGQAGSYPALLVDDAGSARSDTGFNFVLDPTVSYNAHFQVSPTDGATLACADLQLLL